MSLYNSVQMSHSMYFHVLWSVEMSQRFLGQRSGLASVASEASEASQRGKPARQASAASEASEASQRGKPARQARQASTACKPAGPGSCAVCSSFWKIPCGERNCFGLFMAEKIFSCFYCPAQFKTFIGLEDHRAVHDTTDAVCV